MSTRLRVTAGQRRLLSECLREADHLVGEKKPSTFSSKGNMRLKRSIWLLCRGERRRWVVVGRLEALAFWRERKIVVAMVVGFWESRLNGEKFIKINSKSYKILSAYAFGILYSSAPFGRKLFKNLIQKLIALRAEIILGSALRAEIFQNLFKIYCAAR